MARGRKLEASATADRKELRRLLEAAKADHWDDGPRLILADWLEEHGGEADRARAEIIRLQLDTDAGGPDWRLTVERLRDRNVRDWVATHRDFFTHRLPDCERGLLTANVGAAAWMHEGLDDEAWRWVESASPLAVRVADLPGLLASARLATVKRLCLRLGRHFSAPALRSALSQLRCGNVRSLDLSAYGDAAPELPRHLKPGLEELAFSTPTPACWDWAAFLACEGVAGLRGLYLSHRGFDDRMAAMLASALPALRRLSLDADDLTGAGLSSLARMPLRSLTLDGGEFGLDALGRLADGPAGETLEEINLSHPNLSYPRVEGAIPAGMRLPRLRRLRLKSFGLKAEGVRALCEAGLVGWLDLLDIRYNPDRGGEAVAALTGPGPRTLNLGKCGLDDAGLARLAAWPGLSRVRCLDVSDNPRFGEEGLHALAGSPHATSLVALNLRRSGVPMSPGVLLHAPLAARLEWLSLGDQLREEGLAAALAGLASPVLRELYLGSRSRLAIKRVRARLRSAMPGCSIQ